MILSVTAWLRQLRERAYNSAVRSRNAQMAWLLAVCLLLVKPHLAGQLFPLAVEVQTSNSTSQKEQPEVWIDNITFSGFLRLPVSDQEEIAASVRKESHGEVLDGVIGEALERIRAGWQDRGYFKAHVSGEAQELARTSGELHITLFAHVDEHQRYTLTQITFKNSKIGTDFLRSLFPIKDGEVFSREKIATGLENLRKGYGEMGYLNYTGAPQTKLDEEKRTISLVINVDTGKRFYIGSINVLGLDDAAAQALLRDFPLQVGQIYNSRLWELGLLRKNLLPTFECHSEQAIKMDEQRGTVALTLDFRPCSN